VEGGGAYLINFECRIIPTIIQISPSSQNGWWGEASTGFFLGSGEKLEARKVIRA
jgi:hypothetical protein